MARKYTLESRENDQEIQSKESLLKNRCQCNTIQLQETQEEGDTKTSPFFSCNKEDTHSLILSLGHWNTIKRRKRTWPKGERKREEKKEPHDASECKPKWWRRRLRMTKFLAFLQYIIHGQLLQGKEGRNGNNGTGQTTHKTHVRVIIRKGPGR